MLEFLEESNDRITRGKFSEKMVFSLNENLIFRENRKR
jgi:hypothetical protein